MHSVAIIIPYWHGAEYLEACLQSIRDSELAAHDMPDVLIIHNGGEIPEIPLVHDEWIRIIKTQPDIGYARAVNAGLSIVLKTDYRKVCILNQDTKLEKNCLRLLLQAAEQPGLYIPLVMDYDFVRNDRDHETKYTPDIAKHPQEVHAISLVSGVCLCGSADTFRAAGYFDPVFHMYYEDDDYGLRYRQKGGRLYVVPRAIVGHAGRSTERYGGSDLLQRRKSALILRLRHKGPMSTGMKMLRDQLSALVHLRFRSLGKMLYNDLSLFGNPSLRNAREREIQARALSSVESDLPDLPAHIR